MGNCAFSKFKSPNSTAKSQGEFKWIWPRRHFLNDREPNALIRLPRMQVSYKLNYFVLAGAPGSGKTTVLNKLREKGFTCFNEAARFVLEGQLPLNGPALPSNSPSLFIQTMQEMSIKDFESAKSQTKIVFFDRGMPDLVHYAIRFNVPPAEFEATSKQYIYNRNVFMFFPWREIFVNDNVRPISFEKAMEIHQLLTKVYKNLNYNLVEVPFGTAESRADFILKEIKSKCLSEQ